ncbi:MAG TPA: hypothetical protein VK171_05945, partial [Fimbriimonas sp.]|nr:hypothetical protein [Fimbriimonas sp.]
MEIRKLLFVFAAIAAAAFSPAPVPEVVSGTKPVVEQSQAQVAKQQTVNGTVPVVGTVPDRVNEVGHVVDEKAPSQIHKSGENAVALGSSRLEGGSNVVA